MDIAGIYSHKDGQNFINKNHKSELDEIFIAISKIDAVSSLCKKSEEKSKEKLLFSPVALNDCLKKYLCNLGWTEKVPNSRKGFKEPRISMGDGGGCPRFVWGWGNRSQH